MVLKQRKKIKLVQILFKLYSFQVHTGQMKDWAAAIIRDLVATSAFFFFLNWLAFFAFLSLWRSLCTLRKIMYLSQAFS